MGDHEILRDRTARILELLVDQFLKTGEPVGSRTLSKSGIEASPATIRNEMADLEDAGFVTQPHTSAGRIPTDKGYRYWLDSLSLDSLDAIERDQATLKQLDDTYLSECRGLRDLIANSVRVLSEVCRLPGLAVMPSIGNMARPRIQLVGLDRGHVMVVLVTASGIAESHVLAVDNPLSQDDLNHLSRILNENYSRTSMQDLVRDRMVVLRGLETRAKTLAKDLLERLDAALQQAESELFYDGLARLFQSTQPDSEARVESLLDTFMSRDYMLPLLQVPEVGTRVRIGAETRLDFMEDYAVVTAGYGSEGGPRGSIGIVGPKRMDYRRVVGVVNHMRRRLEQILAVGKDR